MPSPPNEGFPSRTMRANDIATLVISAPEVAGVATVCTLVYVTVDSFRTDGLLTV